MLLQLLRAFGLDIPARIDDLRRRIEHRVEHAADEAKQVVRAAAVTAALAGVAAALAAAAFAIGLLALYRWAADNFGPFVGYGVVAGVLLLFSAVLGVVVLVRSRPGRRSPTPELSPDVEDIAPAPGPATTAAGVAEPEAVAAAPATAPAAAGWPELLAFLLPLVMKSPAVGGSLADQLATTLRLGASGKTRRALKGATNMVRQGDRTNLLVAVAGAAILGWIVARQRPRRRR